MDAAPFPTKFRSLDELADYLDKHFKPACIARGEAPNDAHRRGGEVELAQRIVASIRGTEPDDLGD